MAAAWPASPVPNALKLGSVQPTLISSAQSLKRQARSRGGQRWTVSLTYRNLARASLAPVLAQILAMRGQYNTCTFQFPAGTFDTPLGSWATSGAIQVNGASQTGRTINLKGFTPSAANVAKAGDFVSFAGDTKVYMVTADTSADGSGNVALPIEPALTASPANNAAVTSANVQFTMALAADNAESQLAPPFLADVSVTLIEAY